MPTVREEKDGLGTASVPADAYWGIHTLRAIENFPLSGIPLWRHPELLRALAAVKQAAAVANAELGELDRRRAHAIATACEEIRAGALHDQFPVDVLQGGAGTSTNMNANEVIANRGLELLGRRRGEYTHLHPLDDVNRAQSTNDVVPTAVRVALAVAIGRLDTAVAALGDAFAERALAYAGAVKVGRTQLQDALPMTLGQELGAYAAMLREERARLADARSLLAEINLGGTAIGTGLNAHPGYAERACATLAELTGLALTGADDLVEATQDAGAFVTVSGVFKRLAVKLSKVCNDLRLLSSGPRAGFGELRLPALQAGSSIMPGKVNPVIPEAVNQVAFTVFGNDTAVTFAAEAGQLQLNAFVPLIAHKLLESAELLSAACDVLRGRCVRGLTADVDRMEAAALDSLALATALNPHVGYAAASAIAAEAAATGERVAAVAARHYPNLNQVVLSPVNLSNACSDRSRPTPD